MVDISWFRIGAGFDLRNNRSVLQNLLIHRNQTVQIRNGLWADMTATQYISAGGFILIFILVVYVLGSCGVIYFVRARAQGTTTFPRMCPPARPFVFVFVFFVQVG